MGHVQSGMFGTKREQRDRRSAPSRQAQGRTLEPPAIRPSGRKRLFGKSRSDGSGPEFAAVKRFHETWFSLDSLVRNEPFQWVMRLERSEIVSARLSRPGARRGDRTPLPSRLASATPTFFSSNHDNRVSAFPQENVAETREGKPRPGGRARFSPRAAAGPRRCAPSPPRSSRYSGTPRRAIVRRRAPG
jgi:hypothetical protein